MGKTTNTGSTWYAIKNYFMAVAFGILALFIGALATMVGTIAIYILGIALILRGISSLGETNFVTSIVAIVLGGLALTSGHKLLEFDWSIKLSSCLSAAFITIVGYLQRAKIREPYGRDTEKGRRLKVLSRLLFLSLFFGGLILLAGTLLDFIPAFSRVSRILMNLGSILCGAGSIFWIAYTTVVRKALNDCGKTVNGYNSDFSSSYADTDSDGASESEVRSEMKSLANYFTGGFDYPYSESTTCKIKYSVSVSVWNGNITFTLHCDFSGSYPQSCENLVQDNIASMIKKRQTLIINKAEERLTLIDPDRDYTISVKVSTE